VGIEGGAGRGNGGEDTGCERAIDGGSPGLGWTMVGRGGRMTVGCM